MTEDRPDSTADDAETADGREADDAAEPSLEEALAGGSTGDTDRPASSAGDSPERTGGDPPRAAQSTDRRAGGGNGPQSRERRSFEAYAELAALAGLLVLGAVAVAGLYTSTSTAVRRLVATEFEPLFQAALNLVVLLVVGIGLSVLYRRRQATAD